MTETIIKALSVKQPWAGLLMASRIGKIPIKPVENRTWRTEYTGPLAICASKKPETKDVYTRVLRKLADLGIPYPEELCSINGHCLGTVQLLSMIWWDGKQARSQHHQRTRWLSVEDARVWWDIKQYGWVMYDPHPLAKPVPVSGKLSLFEITLDL